MAGLLADPSGFVVGVAVGYACILELVLGFVERAASASAHERDPAVLVAVISLALLVLVAYLLLVILVLAVCVAADGDATRAQQPAAMSPAVVLGRLVNLVIKLAAAFLLFGAVLCVLLNVLLARRR